MRGTTGARGRTGVSFAITDPSVHSSTPQPSRRRGRGMSGMHMRGLRGPLRRAQVACVSGAGRARRCRRQTHELIRALGEAGGGDVVHCHVASLDARVGNAERCPGQALHDIEEVVRCSRSLRRITPSSVVRNRSEPPRHAHDDTRHMAVGRRRQRCLPRMPTAARPALVLEPSSLASTSSPSASKALFGFTDIA